MKEINPDTLSRSNGKQGSPVYIAYKSRVIDVSKSRLWQTGVHMGRHAAGADLTAEIEAAPHGPEVLDRYPEIGFLVARVPAERPMPAFLARLLSRYPFFRRHPHPATVHFPIAFMAAASGFYVLYLVTRVVSFEVTAVHCLGAGILFALLAILSLELDNHYVERLLDYHLETVLVEYPHPMLSSVEIDNEDGGRQAADYFYKKGYRRFAFVGDTSTAEFGIHPISLRLNGFRKELIHLGAKLPDCQILIAPYDINKTREQAVQFLQNQELPLALFAATDLQAISFIQAARQLNLRIPEDIAIMGFDDLDMAEDFNLTTIRQHLDESGEVAVEMLP